MLIVILLLWYIAGVNYINMHEHVHKVIYTRHGIESATVSEDNFYLSATTYPKSLKDCEGVCALSHAINDAVGYNTAVLCLNFWLMFIAWLTYKRLYKNETTST